MQLGKDPNQVSSCLEVDVLSTKTTVEQWPARRAHNSKVVGSNPTGGIGNDRLDKVLKGGRK